MSKSRPRPPVTQRSTAGSDIRRVSLPTSPGDARGAPVRFAGADTASLPLEPASEVPEDALDPISEPLSHASPEPTQTDLEGHYVGPSSGVSFLLRMQKRLEGPRTSSKGTPIFTFGDAPLSQDQASPSFDPSFYLSLSKEYTYRLLERYFDFAVPVDRFLHRPTVQQWLDEFYDTNGAMYDKDEAPTRTAVLFMMFAVAQEHMVPRLDQASVDMRYAVITPDPMSAEADCLVSDITWPALISYRKSRVPFV